MRVIVVGAGEVGSHIAESLSVEGVDVVVIEKNPIRLEALSKGIDILAVPGDALNHEILSKAGIKSAFMVVAVTNRDEVNMAVSFMAAQEGVGHRIVRIENDYLQGKEAEPLRQALQVGEVIDPDRETVLEIMELLNNPGLAEIDWLADRKLAMIASQLTKESPMANKKLADIAFENDPKWNFIVGAVSRDEDTIISRDTKLVLRPGDTVRLLVKDKFLKKVFKQLGVADFRTRNAMVLGGGRIGEMIAGRLEKQGCNVKLLDIDEERTEILSTQYNHIDIIRGDIANADLLDTENIDKMDAVVAVSGRDESNILACLYAKSKGVSEIISILHRTELKNMCAQFGLEKTLSHTTASIEPVLKIVRSEKIKTTVQKVTSFLEIDIEVLELTVMSGSRADGKRVSELKPSKKILIGAIGNENGVEIVRGDTYLSAGDKLVVFASPNALGKVSELFETKQKN